MPKTPGTPPENAKRKHPLTGFRRRENLSMGQFALLVGVTRGTISRIESGALEPTLDLTRRLLAVTGKKVSAAAIVNWAPIGGRKKPTKGTPSDRKGRAKPTKQETRNGRGTSGQQAAAGS